MGAIILFVTAKFGGEVVISRGFASSKVAKVVGLRGADGDFIGLVLTVKAPLGVHMTPYRLSKVQAKELAELLASAAR